MPYTPPSQQSPASTATNSPHLSRSSSYSEDGPRPTPTLGRPSPPRSRSSTSYLHKYRRSPSIKSDGAPPTPTELPDSYIEATDFAPGGSIQLSPTSVNGNLTHADDMPSPPDSSENSESDENSNERGRGGSAQWAELKEAVRSISQRRTSSPERPGVEQTETKSEPTSQITSPTALTTEARKISHSRSATEIYIPHRAQFETYPAQNSDDSDEDTGLMQKPSLVRKKSGELVKPALRPSSRRRYSSMPGTPTYNKSVHFNENENQTRHFLQVDKPIAVSAGTSPIETYDSESDFPFDSETKTERDIKLSNFPADTFERKTMPVRVERIFLSSDKNTLIGVCAVQNLSFHKCVIARFTLDYWKTTSEVVAEFNNDPKNRPTDGCDRFNFHIKLSDLANIEDKTLLLCVRYNVSGHEFWDNNANTNYQVDFVKTARQPAKPVTSPGLGARPLHAIPRSRHLPPTSSRGHRESLDDDFATRRDSDSAYAFGSPNKLLGESPSSIKLKPRSTRGSTFPTVADGPPTNGLGGRYDFGASLSAALTQAQDKITRQDGAQKDYLGPVERKAIPIKATERPDAITTDRPAMGSDQYKDLVQKFCYVGSATKDPATKFTSAPGKQASTPAQPDLAKSEPSKPVANADGADDADDQYCSSSDSDSGTSSPLLEEKQAPTSPARSPFESRSTSPTPLTGVTPGGRASPISFGYPYHHNTRDGYLSDSHTPTAIHG